jgi:hypothetical protein
VITDARKLEDENLELQGYRLLAAISAAAGLDADLETSVSSLRRLGERIGEEESVSFSDLCLGAHSIGSGRYDHAVAHLAKALLEFRSLGKLDNELEARILLCVAKLRSGVGEDLEEEIRSLEGALSSGRYPMLATLIPILKSEAGIRLQGARSWKSQSTGCGNQGDSWTCSTGCPQLLIG